MKSKLVLYLPCFLVGTALSCLFYLFIHDEEAAIFYLLGVLVASILVSLLGGLITVIFETSQLWKWKQRIFLAFGWIAGGMLGGILPSPIVIGLLLNNRAGILYLVNADIWGKDFCRVDIPSKCLGTGYSSLFVVAFTSFVLALLSSVLTGLVGRSLVAQKLLNR